MILFLCSRVSPAHQHFVCGHFTVFWYSNPPKSHVWIMWNSSEYSALWTVFLFMKVISPYFVADWICHFISLCLISAWNRYESRHLGRQVRVSLWAGLMESKLCTSSDPAVRPALGNKHRTVYRSSVCPETLSSHTHVGWEWFEGSVQTRSTS